MKELLYFLLLLLTMNSYADEGNGCSAELERIVARYKKIIASYAPGDLSEVIEYPIEVPFVGNIVSFDEFEMHLFYDDVFIPRYLELMDSIELCELAEKFGVTDDSLTIKSLVLSYDPEDGIYSKGGISSAKQLNSFFREIRDLADKKDYELLSMKFKYPFYAVVKNRKRKLIESPSDFVQCGYYIITNKFVQMINDSIEGKDFYLNPNHGLMLADYGSYWVQEYSGGELFIRVVQPFYEDKSFYE